MATVEQDEEGAVGGQIRDEVLVEERRGDLAVALVVDGDDARVHARRTVAVYVGDLAAVAC